MFHLPEKVVPGIIFNRTSLLNKPLHQVFPVISAGAVTAGPIQARHICQIKVKLKHGCKLGIFIHRPG